MRSTGIRATGLIVAIMTVAGCGGGGGGSSPATAVAGDSATAAPGAAPAPAAPAPATAAPAPAAPAPAGDGTPTPSSIPSVASLPAGLATGGSAAKNPSGYGDTLLTGRWQQDFGPFGTCLPIPASATCSREYSIRFALGYTATGLAGARISELTYFTGASCAAANRLGSVRPWPRTSPSRARTPRSPTTPRARSDRSRSGADW